MIVLDANILIRAVLGRRVRDLIESYSTEGVRFVAPDTVFDEAQKHLPALLKKRGKPNSDLSATFEYLRQIVEPTDFNNHHTSVDNWNLSDRLWV